MRYSVVVPTRDRPRSLDRCLGAIGAAAADAHVLVVDDGSVDGDAVEAVVRRHGAELLRIPRRGAAAARNAGARQASTDVVLFTDDDCVPGRGWGATLAARVAAAPARTIVGGLTEPGSRSAFVRASQSIVQTVEHTTGFCATSNVGCHRTTLLEIPFDVSFAEASGEDRDWCARVIGAGGRVAREPRAVVRHFPSTRASAFFRRHARYGRGARRLRPQPGASLRLGVRVILDGFGQGVFVGALVVLAQVATLVGYLSSSRVVPRADRRMR